MGISSFILLICASTVIVVSILNQVVGTELLGEKGAFIIASICALIMAYTLSFRVGYTLTNEDFKGNMSNLALFLWLMLAFDFSFSLNGLFNDSEPPLPGYISLAMLSPIIYHYYRKIKLFV